MYQIAIDGPSGAGKSTVAKAIAAKLGIVYVDTGALYRTVGYYVRSKNVEYTDTEAVTSLLPEISIEVKYENGTQQVYLNGENLGDKIRQPEISMYASGVSKIPAVRAFLLDTQKSIAAQNSVVMDGRDIGTVILPGAEVKIFLTASNECRARRRLLELQEKGMDVKYEDVLAEMIARDEQDRNRDVAPAVPAKDAIFLDSSALTLEQTIDKAIEIIRKTVAKKKDRRSRFYKVFCVIFRPVVTFISRLHFKNREREPLESGFLICSNHIGALDPVILAAALRRNHVSFMAKKEAFRIPFVGRLIRTLGAFPVDRGGPDVGAVRNAMRLLESGENIGMFPQGTRCPGKDPRSTPVKCGVAMIAVHTGAPILPAFIYRKNNASGIFRKTTVIFGEPIPYESLGYSPEAAGEYARITKMVFDKICALGEEEAKACQKR